MVRDYELAHAERVLDEVNEENAFQLSDGSSVKSLKELYEKVQSMDDSTFYHHVSEEKNDFGNWVKGVHRDYKLASSLFDAGGRKTDITKALGTRIYELQKTIEVRRSKALSETEVAAARLEKILTEAARAKSGKKEVPAIEADAPTTPARDPGSVVDESPTTDSMFGIDMSAAVNSRGESSMVVKEEPEEEKEPAAAAHSSGIRNTPFCLDKPKELDSDIKSPIPESITEKKGKKKKDHLAPPVGELKEVDSEASSVLEDSAEELIRFAETPASHKQVAKEVSSLFSKDAVKTFASEMKNVFASKGPVVKKEEPAAAVDDEPQKPLEPEPDKGTEPIPKPEPADEPKPGQEAAAAEDNVKISDQKDDILSHLKRVYK